VFKCLTVDFDTKPIIRALFHSQAGVNNVHSPFDLRFILHLDVV
jgi:hypothetical protein